MARDPDAPRKPRKARRPFPEPETRAIQHPHVRIDHLAAEMQGKIDRLEAAIRGASLGCAYAPPTDTAATVASFKATIAYGLATLLGLLLASLWVGSAVGTAAALLALATAYLAQSCYTHQHNRWGWLLQTLSIASATFGLLALVLPVVLG